MKRTLLWLGFLLLALLAALGVSLYLYPDNLIGFGLSAYWRSATGQILTTGGIHLSRTGASLDRLGIRESDGRPFLELEGLKFSTTGWVQETHYQVDSVQIDRLELFLRRGADGIWNIGRLGESLTPSGAGPGAGAILLKPWLKDHFFVGEVNFANLILHVQDRGPGSRIPDVTFEKFQISAKDIGNLHPDRPSMFRLNGILPKDLGDGPLQISGTATPFLQPDSASVQGFVENLNPRFFRPYLNEAGFDVKTGTISVRFQGQSTNPNLSGHSDVTLRECSVVLTQTDKKGFLGLSRDVVGQFLKLHTGKEMVLGLDIRGTRKNPKVDLNDGTKAMIAKKVGEAALKKGLLAINPEAGGTLMGVEKLEKKLHLKEKLRKWFGGNKKKENP